MARYIDADEFFEGFCIYAIGQDKNFIKAVEQVLEDTPTPDVVEVKHGEWTSYETEETYGDDGNIWYKCSICGTDAIGRCYDDEWYSYPIRTDYCPKCGADLRTPKERGGEK